MDFSDALNALKAGNKLSRTDGEFIVMMPSLYLPPYNTQDTNRKVNDRTAKWIGEDSPLDSQPYIACSRNGKWYPGWFPGSEDLFAEDWKIV